MKSKKIKIQITHWITGSVLFEYSCVDNTIKKTVEKAVIMGANLRGANLREANLREANLMGANLREANLWGANLMEANLRGANLMGANLREANLWGANLWGANLMGANLWGANLWGANLREAKNLDDGWLDYWWHVHHEELAERLTEPIRRRIDFIKANKPKKEQALRLKLLKPVLGKIPHTKAGWEKLHKKECIKSCPWNSKQQTIFPK